MYIFHFSFPSFESTGFGFFFFCFTVVKRLALALGVEIFEYSDLSFWWLDWEYIISKIQTANDSEKVGEKKQIKIQYEEERTARQR